MLRFARVGVHGQATWSVESEGQLRALSTALAGSPTSLIAHGEPLVGHGCPTSSTSKPNWQWSLVLLSEVLTLEPGDMIAMGTPSGVGYARKPPVWMQPGNTIAIDIGGVGLLSNPIVQEA